MPTSKTSTPSLFVEKDFVTLYEEGRRFEKEFSDNLTLTLPFLTFIEKLRTFQQSENPNIQKLGATAQRLHAPWNLRKFLDLLIPLERLAQKQTTDADWLHNNPDKNLDEKLNLIDIESEKINTLPRFPFVIIADHIRSAFNIGAIFRCADAFALEKIVLTGYSPLPTSPVVHKTALGSEKYTPWEHIEHTSDAIEKYKNMGYKIVSLETSVDAKNIEQTVLPTKMVLIVGNERFGLITDVLEKSDLVLKIPMQGFKNSLNVSTSLSIVAYEWHRQQNNPL